MQNINSFLKLILLILISASVIQLNGCNADINSSDSELVDSELVNDKVSNLCNYAQFARVFDLNEFLVFSMVSGKTQQVGIYTSNPDGTNINKISDDNAWFLSTNNGKIYYSIYGGNGLYRMNYDGNNREKLVDGKITEITFDNNYMYYTDLNNSYALYRSDFNGDNAEIISKEFTYTFMFKENQMYFLNDSDFHLYSMNTKNFKVTEVINEIVDKYCIDQNDIYFSGVGLNRYSLVTNETSEIITGRVQSFSINGEWIYYVGENPKNIEEAALFKIMKDGTNKTLILDHNVYFYESVIYVAGELLYLTAPYEVNKIYTIRPDGSNFNELDFTDIN